VPPPAAKSPGKAGAKSGARPGLDPGAPLDPSALERATGDELVEACAALEDELEELKAKYEMYFLGVELREPAKWRDELKKQVVRLKEAFTRNTGLRFRIQTLHARFLSYERLWQRAAREREEGTYRRDVEKAKRHARGGPVPGMPAAAPKRPGKVALPDEDVDLSDFSEAGDGPAARPALTPPPGAPVLTPPTPAPAVPAAAALPRPGAMPLPAPAAAARPSGAPVLTPVPGARGPRAPAPPTLARVGSAVTPPPRPAAPPAGPSLGERQMRELYDAYLTAKKRCNEDVSKLSYDAVARSVAKQIPEIMSAHKARSVEFKVVIKNGKARLTAVPKV